MQREDGTYTKRLKRWNTLATPRFLTFSCHNGARLLDLPGVRNDLCECIARARARFQFRLVAWVLMPEHAHMMVTPSRSEEGVSLISAILKSIKQPVAQRVVRSLRKANHPLLSDITLSNGEARFWLEGGGFDRNVRTFEEFERELHYIHNNPVKRGLVLTPTDWEWSSARWYAGMRDQRAGWGGRLALESSGCDWPVRTYW